MNLRGWALAFLALVSGLAAFGGASAAEAAGAGCGGSGGLAYVCGAVSVEDMIQAPNTRWLFGSSMQLGRNAPKPEGLYLIDTAAKSVTRATITLGPEPRSGPFAGCNPPDLATLATHGLELRAGRGGRHTLYAINHGGRETIEVFAVETGRGPPKLTWTGCLQMPVNAWGNSITALPGGGLAISKFADIDKLDLAPVLRGETTGFVYIWRPETGFRELPGSGLSGANGLLLSPDGKSLFVNDQGRSQVVQLALDGSGQSRAAKVGFLPDNLRWAPDGTMLATGQTIPAGQTRPAGGWGVARIDPKTMAVTSVMTEAGRPEFANATVALQVGKALWLGTYRGDRIAYVELKDLTTSK